MKQSKPKKVLLIFAFSLLFSSDWAVPLDVMPDASHDHNYEELLSDVLYLDDTTRQCIVQLNDALPNHPWSSTFKNICKDMCNGGNAAPRNLVQQIVQECLSACVNASDEKLQTMRMHLEHYQQKLTDLNDSAELDVVMADSMASDVRKPFHSLQVAGPLAVAGLASLNKLNVKHGADFGGDVAVDGNLYVDGGIVLDTCLVMTCTWAGELLINGKPIKTGSGSGDVTSVNPGTCTDAVTRFNSANVISNAPLVALDLMGTQSTASLKAYDCVSNDINLALIPQGAGALVAAIPDGTLLGGNARGAYAVDWQMTRTAASQVAGGDYSVISGGTDNEITGTSSTIGGGQFNTIVGLFSTIGGGGGLDTPFGDDGNGIAGNFSTISGGRNNGIIGDSSTIGGGDTNTILVDVSIGGVGYSTISGGTNNIINGSLSSIGGGFENIIYGDSSTIAGGGSTIAGGGDIFGGNSITGYSSSIGGGLLITVTGDYSTISGGNANTIIGLSSTIPGGFANTVNGDYSFAAGSDALVTHTGSFVWADSSTQTESYQFTSTHDNQFRVLCTGGAQFVTSTLDGTIIQTGVTLAANDGSSWATVSDYHRKENFKDVDHVEVLNKLVGMPIQSWNYKGQDPSKRHMGPMAQEFNPAFGFNEAPLSITTLDCDGVALAAIQGLHKLYREQQQVQVEQQQRITHLETLLSQYVECR